MVNHKPEQVAALFHEASRKLDQVAEGAARVLNDLFSGRDPGVNYLLNSYFSPTRVTAPWVHPEISANLFQSRLVEIINELVPGLPKMEVKAMTAEASEYEEDQNFLSNWGSRHGNLKEAIRQAAIYGPMGTHVGVRVRADAKLPLEKRFWYEALSHTECGYEPGLRRFVWHRFSEEVPDKPEVHRVVTEIFFPNKADTDCTVYRYELDVASERNVQGDGLGQFKGKRELGAACPVRVKSFMQSPPGEDIPPIECMSWVPLIRAIQDTLEAIDREVNSINNVVLVDAKKINEDELAQVRDNKTGNTVYLWVNDTFDTNDNGVSHTMRPVERDSALGELVAALQQYIALLDDVIGTSALERGAVTGPRKSAAEASILSQASDRRTRNRLSVISELLADVEYAKYTWQPQVYGSEVSVPLSPGLSKNLRVPSPELARMHFTVDVVELGNLSKQGQIETYAAATQIVGATLAQFQGDPPPAVKESLRRYLKALGAEDIAQHLQDPVLAGGPQERYIAYLKNPSNGLLTDPNDPPEPFLIYYNQQLNDPSTPTKAKTELLRVIQFYSQRKQAAAPTQQGGGAVSPLTSPQNVLPSGDIPLV